MTSSPSSTQYNKCKKHSCICQRFRPKTYLNSECFFCNHSVGFHESTNVDITQFPYGPCNESECGCQRYQGQVIDPLRCIYCEHYEGFHSSWETLSNNPITLLNNLHSNVISPNTNSLTAHFTNPRAEVITNLRPTQTIPLYSQQRTHNTIRRRRNGNFPTLPLNNHNTTGRPLADKLTIKYLICFEKAQPTHLPKEGSTHWLYLQSENLIKENIEIFQAAPNELYNVVYNMFNEKLDGQGWILYNGSSGSPRKITYDVSH